MKKKIDLNELMSNKKIKNTSIKNSKKKSVIKTKATKKDKINTKKDKIANDNIIEKKKVEKSKNKIDYSKKERKQKKIDNFEFVSFLLGNEKYGIDSDYVKQIIKYKKPLDMGIKSDFIFGVLSTKEGILPLIDLKKLFNLKSNIKKSGSIIILQYDEFRVGVYVDYLIGIIRLNENQIKNIPPFLPDYLMKFIRGIGVNEDDKIIILIDNDRLFSDENIAQLKSLPEQYS